MPGKKEEKGEKGKHALKTIIFRYDNTISFNWQNQGKRERAARIFDG